MQPWGEGNRRMGELGPPERDPGGGTVLHPSLVALLGAGLVEARGCVVLASCAETDRR